MAASLNGLPILPGDSGQMIDGLSSQKAAETDQIGNGNKEDSVLETSEKQVEKDNNIPVRVVRTRVVMNHSVQEKYQKQNKQETEAKAAADQTSKQLAWIGENVVSEDVAELDEEGSPYEEYTAGQLERAIRRVKEGRAARREGVERQIEKQQQTRKQVQNASLNPVQQKLVDRLEAAGMPVTQANLDKLSGALKLAEQGIEGLNENSFSYLMKNEMPSSVINLYKASVTSGVSGAIGEGQFVGGQFIGSQFIESQIPKEKINQEGVVITAPNIETTDKAGITVTASNKAVVSKTRPATMVSNSIKGETSKGRPLVTVSKGGITDKIESDVQNRMPMADTSTIETWRQIENQAAVRLADEGILVTEESMQNARWLFEQELPIDGKNMAEITSLRNLAAAGYTQDKVIEQLVQEMAIGGNPAEAVLGDAIIREAQYAVTKWNQMVLPKEKMDTNTESFSEPMLQPDEIPSDIISSSTLSFDTDFDTTSETENTVFMDVASEEGVPFSDTGIVELTARRQMEEIRLKMTTEVAVSLLKRGIQLDVEHLSQIVEALRELENTYYRNLYDEAAIDQQETNFLRLDENEIPSDGIKQLGREQTVMLLADVMEKQQVMLDFPIDTLGSVYRSQGQITFSEYYEVGMAEIAAPIEPDTVTVDTVARKPSTNAMERPVRELFTNEMERPAREPFTNAVERPVREPFTNAVERPVREPFTNAVERPVREPFTNAVERPVREPFTNAVERPVREPFTNAVERPVREPFTNAVERPVREPFTNAVERPAREPFTNAIERPARELSANAADTSSVREPFTNEISRIVREPSTNTIGTPVRRPFINMIGRPARELFTNEMERPVREPFINTIGRPARESSTNAVDRPAREPFTNAVDTPVREPSTNAIERPTRESFTNEMDRPARESFTNEMDRPARELFTNEMDRPARELFTNEMDRPARESFTNEMERPVREPSTNMIGTPVRERERFTDVVDPNIEERFTIPTDYAPREHSILSVEDSSVRTDSIARNRMATLADSFAQTDSAIKDASITRVDTSTAARSTGRTRSAAPNHISDLRDSLVDSSPRNQPAVSDDTARVRPTVREDYPNTLDSTIRPTTMAEERTMAMERAMARAGEAYETMGTEVRVDLGDSIRKAFRSVDSLLEQMDLVADEANERAVRILGYNQIEVTNESVEQMRYYDSRVTGILREMKPATVLRMIRDGKNPLDMSMEELADTVHAYYDESVEEEESYSRFLWKLERQDAISQEERSAFIGIYRLLHQIEESDGAAIGAVVEAGQELNLKNLLTAVRTKRSGGIERKIDETFGEQISLERGALSITEQIAMGYVAEISREFRMAMEEPEEDYYKQQAEQLARQIADSRETVHFLQEHGIESSPVLLEAAGELEETGSRGGMRKLFTSFTEGMTEEEIEGLRQQSTHVLENLGKADPQEWQEQVRHMQETMAEQANDMTREDGTITYEKLQQMRILGNVLNLSMRLASQEHYEIPVVRENGELSRIRLTVRHGSEQEGGHIELSMDLPEEAGRLRGDFWLQDGRLNGYFRCETAQGQEQMETILLSVREMLEQIGIEADSLTSHPEGTARVLRYGRGGSAMVSARRMRRTLSSGWQKDVVLNQEQEDTLPVYSTKKLYQVARAIIDAVQSADI